MGSLGFSFGANDARASWGARARGVWDALKGFKPLDLLQRATPEQSRYSVVGSRGDRVISAANFDDDDDFGLDRCAGCLCASACRWTPRLPHARVALAQMFARSSHGILPPVLADVAATPPRRYTSMSACVRINSYYSEDLREADLMADDEISSLSSANFKKNDHGGGAAAMGGSSSSGRGSGVGGGNVATPTGTVRRARAGEVSSGGARRRDVPSLFIGKTPPPLAPPRSANARKAP